MSEMIKTVYVDYDGVIAIFQKEKSLEEVAMSGYTLTVPMVSSICDALKMLMRDKDLTGYEFKGLPAALNPFSIKDKKQMLEKEFGSDFADNAIFVRYGESKAEYAKNGNILIDDFSYNLHEWEKEGGIGIKVYNGINGNHGTWKGYSVHSQSGAIIIYRTLKGILLNLESQAA